jgi:hypothetical protein
MNATELATLSMTELKSMCAANSLEVTGDKRSKSTYILAIETFQSKQTVIEIIETLPAIPDPFELPVVEAVTASSHQAMGESIIAQGTECANETPTNEPPTPTPQLSASIVVIVIATMLWAISIATVMGIRSITLLIAAVWRSTLALYRSIKVSAIDTRSIPILILKGFANDYFPA